MATGKVLGCGQLSDLAWSPDGKTLAAASSTGSWLYNADDFHAAPRQFAEQDQLVVLAYSPDGTRIAAGTSNGTVRIWNVGTGTLERVLEGHPTAITALVFSPDGTLIAAGGGAATIVVWNVENGRKIYNLVFQPDSEVEEIKARLYEETEEIDSDLVVNSLAFIPNGKTLAAGMNDGTVPLWDVATGRLAEGLATQSMETTALAYRADGTTLITGSSDGMLRAWTVGPDRMALDYTIEAHDGMVQQVAANRQWYVSGDSNGEVAVWDENGNFLYDLDGNISGILSLRFCPTSSRLAVGSTNSLITIWDVAENKLLFSLQQHMGPVEQIAWTPDGEIILSGSFDGVVRLWNARTGDLVRVIEVETEIEQDDDEFLEEALDQLLCLAHSPVGAILAVGMHDGQVILFSGASGEEIMRLDGHTGMVRGVAFSADGWLLAASSGDGAVRVWDMQTGDRMRTLTGYIGQVFSVTFSPDQHWLVAVGEEGSIRLTTVDSWERAGSLRVDAGVLHDAAFHPTENRLALACHDRTVRVWDIGQRREVRRMGEHRGSVTSVSYHPGGKLLASGCADGEVRVWDEKGNLLHSLEGHVRGVTDVAFSPNGAWLASGSADGTVWVWDAALDK